MSTSTTLKSQNWWSVKAKIIARCGTLASAAGKLGCSTEAIRKAVSGKCPGVAAKLEDLLKEGEPK